MRPHPLYTVLGSGNLHFYSALGGVACRADAHAVWDLCVGSVATVATSQLPCVLDCLTLLLPQVRTMEQQPCIRHLTSVSGGAECGARCCEDLLESGGAQSAGPALPTESATAPSPTAQL